METVEERPRIIEAPGRRTIKKFGQTIYNDTIVNQATQIITTTTSIKPNVQ